MKQGFTGLLNRRLKATEVYEPIPQDEILDAMRHLGFSRKDVRKNAEVRKTLAEQLKAEALVVGSVRKFGQERARANASRSLQQGSRQGGLASSYLTGVQVLGYVYTARIKLEMQFYGASGKEVATPEVSASRRHQLGGAQIAAFQVIATEEGTELNFGQSPRADRKFRPIVRPGEVSSIAFGTPQYDQTLLGMVTDDVLLKVVKKLRLHVGPAFILPSEVAALEKKEQRSARQVEVFIGSHHRNDYPYRRQKIRRTLISMLVPRWASKSNSQLIVYAKGEPLTDPDTGDVIDYLPVKVGKIEVAEVRNDRVSRVNIIEGFGPKLKSGTGFEEARSHYQKTASN